MTADVPLLALLSASLLGGLLGCASGMLPGLHSNNVATAIGATPGLLLALATLGTVPVGGTGWALVAASAVMACAVAHTVANIVPSIFLAVPEGETALSVLPGHRMVRAGRGGEALRVSVVSSVTSLAIAVALVVPVHALMGPPVDLYPRIVGWIGPLLLGVSALMVLQETARDPRAQGMGGWRAGLGAALVFAGAGTLGHYGLFEAGLVVPLFAGLFGVPAVAVALIEGPPDPLGSGPFEDARDVDVPWGAVARGSLAGTLVGWFPGISSAQATILGVPAGARDDDDVDGARRFIAGVSAVNTANAVFTLVALATLLRVRSGATSAVGGIMAWEAAPWSEGVLPGVQVSVLMLAAVTGGLVAAPVTLLAGARMARHARTLSSRGFLLVLLSWLVVLSVIPGGVPAVLLMLGASGLGMLPPLLGLMRVHLMGAVTLPLALGLLMG